MAPRSSTSRAFMAAAWQYQPREQGDAGPDDDLTPA
jgi:hypothetical protein